LPAIAQSDEGPERAIRPRLERFCENIPAHEERIEERLARIQGDAETRGSLVWLETEKAEAEEAGRENLATMIGRRIAIKTELIDVIELRLLALTDAAVFCVEGLEGAHGYRRYY
jgi:hypothetical protein